MTSIGSWNDTDGMFSCMFYGGSFYLCVKYKLFLQNVLLDLFWNRCSNDHYSVRELGHLKSQETWALVEQLIQTDYKVNIKVSTTGPCEGTWWPVDSCRKGPVIFPCNYSIVPPLPPCVDQQNSQWISIVLMLIQIRLMVRPIDIWQSELRNNGRVICQ